MAFFIILAFASGIAAYILKNFGHLFMEDGDLLVKCFIGCIVTCIVSIGFAIFLPQHEESPVALEQHKSSAYNIMVDDDISTGYAKRYRLCAVVNGHPTIEELKNICNEIAENYKKKKDYNALIIFLCDNKYYCDDLPTLGKAEYAPEGEWTKASEVSAGDYTTFAMKYELIEKDWSKQPTNADAELYRQFKAACKKEHETNPNAQINDDKIMAEVAKANNTTAEHVKSNFLKVLAWSM